MSNNRSLSVVCMAVFYLVGMAFGIFIGLGIGCWVCS